MSQEVLIEQLDGHTRMRCVQSPKRITQRMHNRSFLWCAENTVAYCYTNRSRNDRTGTADDCFRDCGDGGFWQHELRLS
jgi:hypothetical protein